MPESISPEAELLLCCSRARPSAATRERIDALLRQSLDWEYLLATSRLHGVIPLLHSNLAKARSNDIPQFAITRLQNSSRALVHRNLFLTAELFKLMKAFATDGIQAIPFKGPVLAAFAYQDITLRQFSDLDILVQKAKIPEACKVLCEQGYVSGSYDADAPKSEHDHDYDEVAFVQPKYYTFRRPDGRSTVDLQWRVTEQYFSFSLDKEEMWRHLELIPIAGRSVRSFMPTDMLLILCVHGSKHRWEKLKWICDVAELLRSHGSAIDWRELERRAAAQSTERMVRLGLLLAQDLLDASLPDDVSKGVHADKTTKALAVEIRNKLFERSEGPPGHLQRITFYLRTKDRWQDTARFCLRYIYQCLQAVVTPTSIEREMFPLPRYLSFFYILFRPLRLLAKYARSALSSILSMTWSR